MPELTLPFWLNSATLDLSEPLESWLKIVRIQPRWLDEIIVTSNTAEQRFSDLNGITETVSITRWPRWDKSQHLLLHDACRKIIVGDRRLVLLIAEAAEQTTAVLISAPAIVGMYNLSPIAYLDTRLELHLPKLEASLLDLLETPLIKADKKPPQLDALLITPGPQKRPVKSQTSFEHAAWVKPKSGEAGALASCHDLLTHLGTAQRKHGLAVEVTSALDVFATGLERI